MIEAKKEYTSQLQQILSPRIYERFKYIFNGTIDVIKKELSMNHIQNESVVKIFQKQLVSIKDWNESSIIEEYERIKNRSKCNYLDKLNKAVIIANMKILSSIQYGNKRKSKIQVHIPTPTHFIHKCYIECAKEIYKNPYIFDMSVSLSAKEKHQNLRDSLILIDNGINSAIRQLLPISDLLDQNFNSDTEDESEDSRSRSDSESSHESTDSSASKVSSLSSSSDSDSDSEGEDEGEGEGGEEANDADGADGGDGGEEADKEISIVSGGSTESSASSLSSRTLSSKVDSVLNTQSIQDIDIRISGDNETQTMLAGAIAERADNHHDTAFDVSPISQDSTVNDPVLINGGLRSSNQIVEQSGGGFLGALYNTFANSKPDTGDTGDAPAPNNSVQDVISGGGAVDEFKQIVYSGNAVPKGYTLLSTTSTKSTPVQVTHVTQQISNGQKQLFDMNKSIYPPKISLSSQSIRSSKSQGKIIKTIHRPLGLHKNGLSLREIKYGRESTKKIENDNISVQSGGSVKSVKSIKSINSDEFSF